MKIAASDAVNAEGDEADGRRQLVLAGGHAMTVRSDGLHLSAPDGDGSRRGSGSHGGGFLGRLGLGLGGLLGLSLGGGLGSCGLGLGRCLLGGRVRRHRGRSVATDLGTSRRAVVEPQLVDGGEVRLVFRHVGLVEDRVDGACGFARSTVDTGHRVDVEHPVFAFFEVDAVDRADLDAGLVLHVDTGLGDDERHAVLSLR